MANTTVLISEADIRTRITSLAAEIEASYPDTDEIHLVAILKGGFMFMADLVRAMGDRVTMDFMAVSSYGKGSTQMELPFPNNTRAEISNACCEPATTITWCGSQ